MCDEGVGVNPHMSRWQATIRTCPPSKAVANMQILEVSSADRQDDEPSTTSSGICSLNALDEKEIPGCPEMLRTVLQGQGAKVVAARSYSLPLKQSLERRRRSMVTLRPSRHMSGFGGDHVS